MRRKLFSYRPAFRKPYSPPSGLRTGVPLPEFACPETGETVTSSSCVACSQYGVWREGDMMRCIHEYRELEKKGFFGENEEDWEEHLMEIDPEKYGPEIERRRQNERDFKKKAAQCNESRDQGNAEKEAETGRNGQGKTDDQDREDEDEDFWK